MHVYPLRTGDLNYSNDLNDLNPVDIDHYKEGTT